MLRCFNKKKTQNLYSETIELNFPLVQNSKLDLCRIIETWLSAGCGLYRTYIKSHQCRGVSKKVLDNVIFFLAWPGLEATNLNPLGFTFRLGRLSCERCTNDVCVCALSLDMLVISFV